MWRTGSGALRHWCFQAWCRIRVDTATAMSNADANGVCHTLNLLVPLMQQRRFRMCQQHPAHDGCHCRCCLLNSLCSCCCCLPFKPPSRGVMGISFDHKESRWLLPVMSYQVTCMACITSNMSCIAQGVHIPSTCAAAPVVSLGNRASCPARCFCHCDVTCGGGLRAPQIAARLLNHTWLTSNTCPRRELQANHYACHPCHASCPLHVTHARQPRMPWMTWRGCRCHGRGCRTLCTMCSRPHRPQPMTLRSASKQAH